MNAWYEDPVFDGDPSDGHFQLSRFATPAFRLSLKSFWRQGHPFEYLDEYRRLFSVFEPILRRDAERLLMIETAGKKPRRRKSITNDDWDPFGHLMSKVLSGDDPAGEISEWRFVGFDFQHGFNGDDRHDIGPTKFFLNITDAVQLDAYIPVPDFAEGRLDVDALKQALLALPVVTAIAGYGMCISDTFDWPHDGGNALLPVARKFPVLDLCVPGNRSWRGAGADEFKEFWLNGINWLTLVGEPVLSALGGADAVTRDLSPDIQWSKGRDTVLFQLGPRPITGERGADDALLPLYFALGDRLRPLDGHYPSANGRTQYPFGHVGDQQHKECNNDWARRFYDRRWFEGLC